MPLPLPLAAGGRIHGSSTRSASAIARLRNHLLLPPAMTTCRSSNSNSTSTSVAAGPPGNAPTTISILRARNSRSTSAAESAGNHVDHGARESLRNALDDRRHEAHGGRLGAADSRLAGGRIGEKLEHAHTLAQLVEHRGAARQQRSSVDRRRDALLAAVEKPLADCVLELRIDFDTTGSRIASATAAFPMLPASTTVISMWSCLSLTCRPMRPAQSRVRELSIAI